MPKQLATYQQPDGPYVSTRYADGTVVITSTIATDEEKHERYVEAMRRELEMVERRIAQLEQPLVVYERPEHPMQKMNREVQLFEARENREAVLAELERTSGKRQPTGRAARGRRPNGR